AWNAIWSRNTGNIKMESRKISVSALGRALHGRQANDLCQPWIWLYRFSGARGNGSGNHINGTEKRLGKYAISHDHSFGKQLFIDMGFSIHFIEVRKYIFSGYIPCKIIRRHGTTTKTSDSSVKSAATSVISRVHFYFP